MAVEADLAGFAEAQSRLRAKLGQDVAFYGPVTLTFPANTPLDPETGRPYDPTITGSAATASGMVRCSVARTIVHHDQTEDSAAGVGEATHVALLADDTPANRAIILPAETFVVTSAAFKVERTKLDPPVREAGRIVVFGRAK